MWCTADLGKGVKLRAEGAHLGTSLLFILLTSVKGLLTDGEILLQLKRQLSFIEGSLVTFKDLALQSRHMLLGRPSQHACFL